MKRVDLEFFTFCYKLVGIQRHLKVLGIFVGFQKEIKNIII